MKKMLQKMVGFVARVHFEIWLALIFICLAALLSLTGVLSRLESGLFDVRFRIKSPPSVSKKVVILAIDDASLNSVGRWPWRRSVHGRALDMLRGFGVRQVIFDVEFTEESARALNKQDQKIIPREVARNLDDLNGLLVGMQNMAASGAPANWSSILSDFSGHIKEKKRALLSVVGRVGQDDDLAFSLAIRRSGNVVLPVRAEAEKMPDTPRHEYILNTYMYRPGKGQLINGFRRIRWLGIPANPLHRAADRLGFTNVEKDEDGVRRRIELFRVYRNRLIPQLAFVAVMRRLGVEWKDVQIEPGESVTLKNCTLPGKKKKQTIVIPIDEKGQMLVNWVGEWQSSFPMISYHELFDYHKAQQKRRQELTKMDGNYFGGQMGLDMVHAQLSGLELKRASGQALAADEVKGIEMLNVAFNTSVTNGLTILAGAIKERKNKLPSLKGKEKEAVNKEINGLKTDHGLFSREWANYQKERKTIARALAGATIIVGQTASSTTDLGTTPVDTNSPQVFLHANVYNSILQKAFIRRASPVVDLLLLVLVTLIFAFLSQKMAPSSIIILGFSIIGGYAVLNTFVFSWLGIWIDFISVQLSLAGTFAAVTSTRYLAGDKEKKYIKNAFQHYVAAEVVEDLVAGRANLKLGGERKVISAFFSDVRGFSSISENLKPDELVDLLNDYLTDMTDIVMAHKGTVDKFEGDAVIAMYGAPVYYEDHAVRACLSCLDQQAKITEKNAFWKEKYGCDLFVRMGVNTGPMVVGNMGSRNRFDYTMMGDAVNLAARLEGVNKYYNTATMISQFTYEAARHAVVAREIDRLRVVGKKESVTVYELIGKTGELDAATEEKLASFDRALDLYKEKRWGEAKKAFIALLKAYPDDGPAGVYRDRCAEFAKKPPAKDWDGVYTLRNK